MKDVKVGEIVQIVPDCKTNQMFGACLMVVSEIKTFGVQGYVQSLGRDGGMGGQAYIRLPWDEFEETGAQAPFQLHSGDEDV